MKQKIVSMLVVLLTLVGTVIPVQAVATQGDVVFVIDESGSMGPDIAAVTANAALIFTNLQGAGDFKVGLVGFGGFGANPRVVVPVTNSQAAFVAGLNTLAGSGGFQPGFEATILATSGQMGLRSGVASCTILITDEDADDPANKAAAIAALNGRPSVFLGIFDPTFAGTEVADYGMVSGLAGATGGAVFDLSAFEADPSGVLTTVLNTCKTNIPPPPTGIPEFPSIVLPIGAALGMMMLVSRRREN